MEQKDLSIANSKRSTGVDLSDERLAQAWIDVKESRSSFVTVTLNNNKVHMHSNGTSVEEMIASLTDDDAYFGVLSVNVDTRVKFFTMYMVGSNVGGMKKGKGTEISRT